MNAGALLPAAHLRAVDQLAVLAGPQHRLQVLPQQGLRPLPAHRHPGLLQPLRRVRELRPAARQDRLHRQRPRRSGGTSARIRSSTPSSSASATCRCGSTRRSPSRRSSRRSRAKLYKLRTHEPRLPALPARADRREQVAGGALRHRRQAHRLRQAGGGAVPRPRSAELLEFVDDVVDELGSRREIETIDWILENGTRRRPPARGSGSESGGDLQGRSSTSSAARRRMDWRSTRRHEEVSLLHQAPPDLTPGARNAIRTCLRRPAGRAGLADHRPRAPSRSPRAWPTRSGPSARRSRSIVLEDYGPRPDHGDARADHRSARARGRLDLRRPGAARRAAEPHRDDQDHRAPPDPARPHGVDHAGDHGPGDAGRLRRGRRPQPPRPCPGAGRPGGSPADPVPAATSSPSFDPRHPVDQDERHHQPRELGATCPAARSSPRRLAWTASTSPTASSATSSARATATSRRRRSG